MLQGELQLGFELSSLCLQSSLFSPLLYPCVYLAQSRCLCGYCWLRDTQRLRNGDQISKLKNVSPCFLSETWNWSYSSVDSVCSQWRQWGQVPGSWAFILFLLYSPVPAPTLHLLHLRLDAQMPHGSGLRGWMSEWTRVWINELIVWGHRYPICIITPQGTIFDAPGVGTCLAEIYWGVMKPLVAPLSGVFWEADIWSFWDLLL